jgi:hypothetical protein
MVASVSVVCGLDRDVVDGWGVVPVSDEGVAEDVQAAKSTASNARPVNMKYFISSFLSSLRGIG